ncbi:MAG: hypothetical protein ABF649_09425 [Bacillus sp. (in: firmicutes)]
MKKELLFAFTAFFFMSLSAITGAYALGKEEEETIIYHNKVDLLLDGNDETIQLKGISNQEEKELYKEVVLEVVDKNGDKKNIHLEGGYRPTLQLVTLDKDKNPLLFIKVLTDEKGSKTNYYLYTCLKNELKEIEIPELPSIASQLKTDYKAELTIEGQKTYSFDLFDRKKQYEKLGVYHNGQLNEPTELIVQPYASLSNISYHQKFALKGKQKISGVSETDTIAYLETIWTRHKNEWKLEKIKMKEISKKEQ